MRKWIAERWRGWIGAFSVGGLLGGLLVHLAGVYPEKARAFWDGVGAWIKERDPMSIVIGSAIGAGVGAIIAAFIVRGAEAKRRLALRCDTSGIQYRDRERRKPFMSVYLHLDGTEAVDPALYIRGIHALVSIDGLPWEDRFPSGLPNAKPCKPTGGIVYRHDFDLPERLNDLLGPRGGTPVRWIRVFVSQVVVETSLSGRHGRIEAERMECFGKIPD